MDDLLCCAKRKDVPNILRKFNSIHPNLKLTVEEPDSNNELPFLDIKIRHLMDGSTETDIFRKPSHTGVVMNFLSEAPWQHKKAAAIALIENHVTQKYR